MREPEKQKVEEVESASNSNKLYPDLAEKSSANSPGKKTGAQVRKARWEKACKEVPMAKLAKELCLEKDGENYTCPYCGEKSSLELDHTEQSFKCKACGKKGTSVSLIKQVKSLSNWQVIAYLEALASASCPANEVEQPCLSTENTLPGNTIPDAPEMQKTPTPQVGLTGPVIASPEASEVVEQPKSESKPRFIPCGNPSPDAPEEQTPPAPRVVLTGPVIASPEASEVPEQPASESQPQFIPSGHPSPDETVREKTVEPALANPLESSTPPAPEIDERIRRIRHYQIPNTRASHPEKSTK